MRLSEWAEPTLRRRERTRSEDKGRSLAQGLKRGGACTGGGAGSPALGLGSRPEGGKEMGFSWGIPPSPTLTGKVADVEW